MGTPVEDAVVRGWTNFVHRLDGPLHARFFVQPTVATLLAVRAGLRDARAGNPPFFAALRTPEKRRAWLQRAWSDVGKVFLVAVLIDVIYQVWFQRGIYVLELLVTATVLALAPYVLIVGPSACITRALLAARDRRARRDTSL
ncbi:hypothetical protein A7982_13745 [Minicystis rosea]|nr:hypothetical protein A7982_13745 [Minicystis rosea]